MSETPNRQDGLRQEAERTADDERKIQHGIDAKEQRSFQPKGEGGDDKPMQAGAREYPAPPLPGQHLEKPGVEAELQLKPMWDAPYWKGSGKLEGKVALVTGADSGIGRAVAVLFAREGADVAIAYLDSDGDAEVTREAVEKEGRRAITIAGDVADPAFAKAAVQRTLQELGKLDILVNNAAFQEHAESIEEITEAHFDRTLKTNLYGYFHMAKAAAPHMQPGSAIVMTGSVTGIEGSKALLDYAMTKGGIHAFARSLAGSLIKKGIRVNVVAPGPVWTPLNPADRPAEKMDEFGQGSAMGRAAQPEELSPAYVFLAAPSCSSYISGSVLEVLGGPTG